MAEKALMVLARATLKSQLWTRVHTLLDSTVKRKGGWIEGEKVGIWSSAGQVRNSLEKAQATSFFFVHGVGKD